MASAAGAGAGPAIGLAAALAGGRGVLVAGDLAPGDVAAIGAGGVAGIAVAAGAPLSHAAILARSLGIPTVTGLGPGILAVDAGTTVLVDGTAGTVVVDPTAADVAGAEATAGATAARREEARRRAAEPATTVDGHTVAVVANVGSAEDARLAVAEGADGVGMLRTEFAFLNRTDPPPEDEQFAAYQAVADALGHLPLVIRTLDLGADIPVWGGAAEPNPALGNRGLRLALGAPALFEPQLRAVARLAATRPVAITFPMVTTVGELRRARAALDAVRGGTAIEVGITVEVPAAAVLAERFAPLVDFFTVGTNDLTQYTLAADRANAAVAGLADGLDPAVLRLLRWVAAAAEEHHRPVCVVGELGCDPVAVPVLVGIGVTELSVRPNAVALVKQAVRATDVAAARALAEKALDAESAAEVRRLAAGW
ncbi:MAG TPA: putative PEP-binding protein [Acidimicrobiales bacterium]|nr:putative PEP-binding protein [Acidimicrobiales bacterium]